MSARRVAIVGGLTYADMTKVKGIVRALDAGTVVLIGSESAPLENTVARQANCSKLVHARFVPTRQRATGDAIAARDRAMFGLADFAIVFGDLPQKRLDALAAAECRFTWIEPPVGSALSGGSGGGGGGAPQPPAGGSKPAAGSKP